jgi:NAD(P)-dependent dehydrogenase (short-subunit alcohol dehydrogenase family)
LVDLATGAGGEASRELEGRVAIVSGSTSVIGLGDAEALAVHRVAGGQPSGRHLSNLAERFHRPMRRQQRK